MLEARGVEMKYIKFQMLGLKEEGIAGSSEIIQVLLVCFGSTGAGLHLDLKG